MCSSAITFFLCIVFCILAFSEGLRLLQQQRLNSKRLKRINRLDIAMLDTTIVSLVAGAFAGSVGVGISYPLDSLKTKTQVYASTMESSKRSPGMIEMCRVVIKKEGIGGFYQGVKGVMLGQAVIKSVAFSANAFALNQMLLQAQVLTPTLLHLCVAGSFSGLVTSFFVNPIERIKVLMQADRTGLYKSEVQCLQQIIKDDGVLGLLSRGLDATILREVPSYAIYFVVYTLLIQSAGNIIGAFSPLICGASAGMACWIPVFPFDVIKTNLQNTQGGKKMGLFEMAVFLKDKYGYGIFFDGLSPKLARAALNHAVTFFVYDIIFRSVLP